MVLELVGVQKAFRTPDGETLPILDVPAFAMQPGEQVALHGPSGTGKTTLLHIIAGILTPNAGMVTLAGQRMNELPESRRDAVRALHLGYVFQTFNLLQGFSALENVELGMMFGRGLDRAYARHLLERVGLGARLRYRPEQLSVGQQQRVAVARALAGRPSLVLADEPTGNLDRRHADAALDLIREICAETGAALLLVSHDEHVLSRFSLRRELGELNRAALSTAGGTAPATAPGAGR